MKLSLTFRVITVYSCIKFTVLSSDGFSLRHTAATSMQTLSWLGEVFPCKLPTLPREQL